MANLEKFVQLGLSENTLSALAKKGFEEPTEIQELVIPVFLNEDVDIIGQAQTGTGKTAAFGLPLIQKLTPNKGFVQAIVLCPTRELAVQVAEEISSLRGEKRLSVLPVYGGSSIGQQLRKLDQGVDIVVGTPGRVIDHIKRKSLKLEHISHVILDEADEMLNMGFIEDMEFILKSTSADKRVLLFSATMPDRIKHLAKRYMGEHKILKVKTEQLTANLTDQIYFEVNEWDKFEALCRIIDVEKEFYALIFCRTKVDVDRTASKLIDRSYDAEAIHGDISQNQRERIMKKFKDKKLNILVATDVAARGIDVQDLTHVINYSLPQDPESYVHRIGRTGRAGKEGTAITFVTPEEYRKLLFIKKVAKADIRKGELPEIEEVINLKRSMIIEEMRDAIELANHEDYRSLAEELVDGYEPLEVLSAMLKYTFEDELDVSNYKHISDVSVNKSGKTRLFVARGKKDNFTPQSLAEYIRDETDVQANRLHNIRIYDDFSFINASFVDAELILEHFKKNKKGNRPIVEKAKGKKN